MSLTLVFLSPAQVEASEFRLEPSLSVREEYTDNVFLAHEDEEEEYITRILPSFSALYRASLWDWDVSYTLDSIYYAKDSRGDEITHDLDAAGKIRLMEGFLFLDIRDRFDRVTVDITRDFTRESLFINQSDRNIFTANPYVNLRLSEWASFTAGYLYANTWYEEQIASDKIDNSGYANLSFEFTPRSTFSAGYSYLDEDTDARDFIKEDVSATFSYEYGRDSIISLAGGNTWIDFQGLKMLEEIVWKAIVNKGYDTGLITAQASRGYDENPVGTITKVDLYKVSTEYELSRSRFGIVVLYREYSDAISDILSSKSYLTEFHGGYDISAATATRIDGVLQYLDRKLGNPDINRYIVGVEAERLLAKTFSFTVGYSYTRSESEDVFEDYDSNRAFVEFRKTF